MVDSPDVKELLEKMWKAFKRRDAKALRKINDRFVNLLIAEERPHLLKLALLSYVLAKVASKPRYFRNKEGIRRVERALESLAAGGKIEEVEEAIVELDEEDPRFLFDLFTKAKVKLAATLYAKGISLGKASKLTGIPKAEILNYAGKTMMFDRLREEKSVKERVRKLLHYIEG